MTQDLNASADFQILKNQLRATWMAGDFGMIARTIEPHAEDFIARRGIVPGMRVLDVACGTGNLAIPAAKRGAMVHGIDIAPNLVEQARERARNEGVEARFDEGDAEQLPFPDHSFDVVVSMYGAMFAPRPERVAAELTRVCRPGGQLAMANWTAQGFVGKMFKVVAMHAPPPPGIPSPVLWGDEATARQRLAGRVADLQLQRIAVEFEYPFSVPETIEFYRQYFGPVQKAFGRLSEEGRQALRRDLERLWEEHNQASDGTTHVQSEYLEVVATCA